MKMLSQFPQTHVVPNQYSIYLLLWNTKGELLRYRLKYSNYIEESGYSSNNSSFVHHKIREKHKGE